MPKRTPQDSAQTVAALRRELAQLRAERDEALDQQAATAEVLQVINSSPGDLMPVFEAILDKAHALCEAERGTLFLYDGEKMKAAVAHGYPADVVEHLRAGVEVPPHHAPLFSGKHVHVPDLSKDNNATGRVVSGRGGVRTNLLVPLFRNGTLLGMISCNRTEVRPFSDKEIALIENFAQQAVIAIQNARLLTETREALDQQTATAEVLQVINANPGELQPVFDVILEKAMALCDIAYGDLELYDGDTFRAVATHGLTDAFAEQVRRGYPAGDNPATRSLIVGERVSHIVNMAEADFSKVFTHAPAKDEGHQTLLCVPLRRENALLGMIACARSEVRAFSEKEIALLESFAAQAVIAMENARLITETQEALDQQTATAEVLGVINSSPGDLAPVFDAMLEKAMRLCGAVFGSLATYDGEVFHSLAFRGMPQSLVAVLSKPYPPIPGSFLSRLVDGEVFGQALDLAALPPNDDAHRRGLIDLGGARSTLWMALRKEDALLGMIAIYRQEVRPFSGKEIALLQNFAAQAVIAMENARLITETREALEQQTAAAEVLQVINSSPGDLQPVFDVMLDRAMHLCGAAFGMMMVTDGEQFPTVAARGVPAAFAEFRRHNPVTMDQGPVFVRLMGGESFVHSIDLKEDDAYRRGIPQRRALVDLGGARSSLVIALRKDDAMLGLLQIYRQEVRPFSEKDIALLQNFAAQAVIAMENARLLGELRERTDEIAGWNRELEARVAAQLGELERTGRLRRFLAPQLADLIVAQGDESILESHRREIVVVFCDLRGFTPFAERAEPEEVMALLRDYHAALGPIVASFEGTLDHYAGDGIMVFFNDPLPTPEPAKRAIDMAVAMRAAAQALLQSWRRHGHDIGFGVGISQGYATLGQIGFAERMDYTAIGTVTNLAARLCGEAKDGQILISRRVATAIEDSATLEEIGDLSLKGLSQAVAVYNVAR